MRPTGPAPTARLPEVLAAAERRRGGAFLVVDPDAALGGSALEDRVPGRWTTAEVRATPEEAAHPYAAVSLVAAAMADRVNRRDPDLLGQLVRPEGIDGDREAWLRDALLRLLERAAGDPPLLVVVDAAEHLDLASVRVLLHAVRRLTVPGLALAFVTRRPTEELLVGGLPVIAVAELDPAAAAELLRVRSGVDVPPNVIERLLVHTHGRSATLRQVADRLTRAQLTGSAPLPRFLPAVDEVDGGADLPDVTTAALLLAALADGDTSLVHRTLRRLGRSLRDLEAAELAGIVTITGGAIRFTDPLRRSAVVERAGDVAVRRAHRQLGDSLEPDGDDPATRAARAWHLARAVVTTEPATADALAEVAASAAARFEHERAAHAYAEAARISPGGDARTERLRTAARHARVVGAVEWARHLLEDALQAVCDPALAAELRVDQALTHAATGASRTARRALQDQADALMTRDPITAGRALTGAAGLAMRSGAPDLAVELSQRAGTLLPDGDLATLARVTCATAQVIGGDTGAARVALDVRAAESWPLPDADAVETHADALLACSLVGDPDVARGELERLIEHLELHRARGALARPYLCLAWLQLRRGWWDAAETSLRTAAELGERAGQLALVARAAALTGRCWAYRGDPARALQHTFRTRRIARSTDAERVFAYAAAAEGLAHLSVARPDLALPHLEEAAHGTADRQVADVLVGVAGDLLEAYVAVGRTEDAMRVRKVVEREAATREDRWAEAVAERGRILLDDVDLTERLARCDQLLSREPFERARTTAAAAHRAEELGEDDHAQTLWRRAAETFAAIGSPGWAAQAEAHLRTSEPQTPGADPLAGLTAQERRVVELVATGATNRTVAEALFLSPKTVEYHLHKAFVKLGVHARAELIHLLAG
jgi:DNA-binding CsgD family transcriptional regulator